MTIRKQQLPSLLEPFSFILTSLFSIWMYLCKFQDVYNFFTQSDSPFMRYHFAFYVAFALLGLVAFLRLRWKTKWIALAVYSILAASGGGWIWMKGTDGFAIPSAILLLPGTVWTIDVLMQLKANDTLQPGSWKDWTRVFLGFLALFVFFSMWQSFFTTAAMQDKYSAWEQFALSLSVAKYSGLHAGIFAAGVWLLVMGILWIGRRSQSSLFFSTFLATALLTSVFLLFFHVFDTNVLQVDQVVYLMVALAPLVVWMRVFLERIGQDDAAMTTLRFGRIIQEKSHVSKFVDNPPYAIGHVLFFCIAVVVAMALLYQITFWQTYLIWGVGTWLIYLILLMTGLWGLLSAMSHKVQWAAIAFAGVFLVGGLSQPMWNAKNDSQWRSYREYDRTIQFFERVRSLLFPSQDPKFLLLDLKLEQSRKYGWNPNVLASKKKKASSVPAVKKSTVSSRSQRPHIFFIVNDALRARDYGRPPLDQKYYPGMAEMMKTSILYANNWTSYNATSGSLPAYVQGYLHPIWYQKVALLPHPRDYRLFRRMKTLGYRFHCLTGHADLADLCPKNAGRWPRRKPTRLAGDPEHIFNETLRRLDKRDPKRPYFFYLHAYNTHVPLYPRPKAREPRHALSALHKSYLKNVDHLDSQLKRFLGELQKRGLRENSMIIFTSDHGEEFNDFGNIYHGFHLNPVVMQVPLMIQYPSSVRKDLKQKRVAYPTNLIDIAPTILDVLGLAKKRFSRLQGYSLLRIKPKEAQKRKFYLFSWRSPHIGKVSFSPLPRIDIVDAQMGTFLQFVKKKDDWAVNFGAKVTQAFFDDIIGTLKDIFKLHEQVEYKK